MVCHKMRLLNQLLLIQHLLLTCLTFLDQVVRHSVPKSISPSVTYRSPNCEVIQISNSTTATKSCDDPCAKTLSVLGKAARRKKKTSTVPAKSNALLASCSSEKLVATVKASRVECKQLESRLKELEAKIKDDGVGISGALENDILKIMGGQNFEATPHMKFFWEQQLKLLKSDKFGRQYHPQIKLLWSFIAWQISSCLP